MGSAGKLASIRPFGRNRDVYKLNNGRINNFKQQLNSGKQLLKVKNTETTSSFFRDDFSFNRTRMSSQSNEKRPQTSSKKVVLTRRATTTIGVHQKIHHGTIDMTLNELKNIFKLRYENKDGPPIDGVIFQLGVNENCPQIN